MSEKVKKRSVRAKYSRPCDGCALRKVRCDQRKPCSRCIEHNVPCTDNRLRKKCGPKHIHKKTRDSINNLSMGNLKINTLGNSNEILTIDKLLPCLQIYQTWYYGVWPVLSVAHLVSRIIQLNPSSDSTLTSENATSYSLCCAVCAAITRQLTFLTIGSNPIVDIPSNIESDGYAKEAIRARNLFDYRLTPTYDNLLISFFLYIYYVNVQGGIQAAIIYMKEAISIAQLLGLHDPRAYADKSPAEVHRLRKIYYMLLVTERFMCIEDNVPVCLEPSIPLPSLEDEEYSGLLEGFIELVKIFSIPDKKFFDNLINYSKKNPSNLNKFKNLFTSSGVPTKQWITKVQVELSKIHINNGSSDTQKLNIILSKYWMKSLAWHISSQNGLLLKNTKTQSEVCLSYHYPIQIAKDFLIETQNLPLFAFESNGPGVCVKLLELALAVADSVNECIINKVDTFTAFNILTSVFNLVSKFKSDITITQELYEKVEAIVNKKATPSPFYTKSYIREVNEDGESISDHSQNSTDEIFAASSHPLEDERARNAYDSFAYMNSRGLDKEERFQRSMKEDGVADKNPDQDQSPDIGNEGSNEASNKDASPFARIANNLMMSPHQYDDYNFDFFKIPSNTNLSNLLNNTGTITPNGLAQTSATNINIGFQTFNHTLSPSKHQMQQLEIQLQHQFHQFHPTQFNQYQYGTPANNEVIREVTLGEQTPNSSNEKNETSPPSDSLLGAPVLLDSGASSVMPVSVLSGNDTIPKPKDLHLKHSQNFDGLAKDKFGSPIFSDTSYASSVSGVGSVHEDYDHSHTFQRV